MARYGGIVFYLNRVHATFLVVWLALGFCQGSSVEGTKQIFVPPPLLETATSGRYEYHDKINSQPPEYEVCPSRHQRFSELWFDEQVECYLEEVRKEASMSYGAYVFQMFAPFECSSGICVQARYTFPFEASIFILFVYCFGLGATGMIFRGLYNAILPFYVAIMLIKGNTNHSEDFVMIFEFFFLWIFAVPSFIVLLIIKIELCLRWLHRKSVVVLQLSRPYYKAFLRGLMMMMRLVLLLLRGYFVMLVRYWLLMTISVQIFRCFYPHVTVSSEDEFNYCVLVGGCCLVEGLGEYVFAVSQLSGSHGEWTQSDDVDQSMGDSILAWFMRRDCPAVLQGIDRALQAANVIPIPVVQAQPVIPPVVPAIDRRQLCRHFLAGDCRHRNCRFSHEIPPGDGPPPIQEQAPARPPLPNGNGRQPNVPVDMYEISQAVIFVNRENTSWFRRQFVWFHHLYNLVWMWLEAAAWFLVSTVVVACLFTDMWPLSLCGLYVVYRNLYGRLLNLNDHCVNSYRIATSITPYVPMGVSFSDPVYEGNLHIANMAHYLGYRSQRRVSVYMRISQKMLVRAGGSLSGQATMVANLIGYGMREFPEGDYSVMSNTALLVFQQVLANKDRARYALPCNVGSNATVSTTLP